MDSHELKSHKENPMTNDKKKPNPDRVAFLRTLPLEVKEQITAEESQSFMFEEEIPESLFEKIKDFLSED